MKDDSKELALSAEEHKARITSAIELENLREELRAKYGTFPSSVEYTRNMREGKI